MPAEFLLDVDIRVPLGPRELVFQFKSTRPCIHIAGPSGSGKSTFLRALLGLVPHATGKVVIHDRTLLDTNARVSTPTWGRELSWCPQDAALVPHFTVRENLLLGARGDSRLDEVARMLSANDLLARSPATLSGGERQRVALGRALLSESRTLLLDEPFNAQPRDARDRIARDVASYAGARGSHVVLVTHDADDHIPFEAERWILSESGFSRRSTTEV